MNIEADWLHTVWIGSVLATFVAVPTPAGAQDPDPDGRGRAIAEEVDRRSRGFGDHRTDIEMLLRDSDGREARRALELWVIEVSEAEERSRVRFESPPDIRGTELLTFSYDGAEDEQWLYLPALRRTKRISASGRSSSFVGSEFTYEDLVHSSVEEYEYHYIGEEVLEGVPTWVVERVPTYEGTGYARQQVWVDQDEYRIRRIDFWDLRDRPLKTLRFSGYEQYVGGIWEPGRALMSNTVTGASTLLEWVEYRFGTGLTPGMLTRGALGRINE